MDKENERKKVVHVKGNPKGNREGLDGMGLLSRAWGLTHQVHILSD